MINYAAFDCLATSYFIRPILEEWSLEQVKNVNLNDLFQAFESKTPPPLPQAKKKIKNIDAQKFINIYDDDDIEPISDDEIYLNQLITPTNEQQEQNIITEDKQTLNVKPSLIDSQVINENELSINLPTASDNDEADALSINVLLNDTQLPVDNVREEKPERTRQRRTRQQRPEEYRRRNNQKRNSTRKKRYYRYSIKRRCYPRFPVPVIRKILQLYQINYTHIKPDDNNPEEIVIGLRDRRSEQEAERQLSTSFFNRQAYFHYRKLFRRKTR